MVSINCFAERFINLCEEKDIPPTGQYISNTTGIRSSTLTGYINGLTYPSFKNAIILADFFDVDLDYLACRSNTRSKLETPFDINGLNRKKFNEVQEYINYLKYKK